MFLWKSNVIAIVILRYLYIIPIYVFLQIWGSLGEPLTFRTYFHQIWKPSPVLSLHSRYENHYNFGFATCLLVSSIANKGQRSWRWLYRSIWHWQFSVATFSLGSQDFWRTPMGSYEKLANGQRYSEAKKSEET